jgi:hypothetical protein
MAEDQRPEEVQRWTDAAFVVKQPCEDASRVAQTSYPAVGRRLSARMVEILPRKPDYPIISFTKLRKPFESFETADALSEMLVTDANVSSGSVATLKTVT